MTADTAQSSHAQHDAKVKKSMNKSIKKKSDAAVTSRSKETNQGPKQEEWAISNASGHSAGLGTGDELHTTSCLNHMNKQTSQHMNDWICNAK